MKKPCLLALLLVAAALLWGQAELKTMLEFVSPVTGANTPGCFTSEISGEGDLNGDGFDDIVIVGKPYDGEDWERELYIYFGSAEPDSIADIVLEPPFEHTPNNTKFGDAVAYNGDINGDGVDDLVVGAPYVGIGIPYVGKVYIYWGGDTISATPDVELDGFDYGDDCWILMFGNRLDIAGDLNDDGYNDLVVGAPGPSGNFNGQVDVFWGGPDFDTISDWHVQGESSDFLSGRLCTGDFNGDDFDDLAFSYYVIPGYLYGLGVCIYLGGEEFDTTPDYSTEELSSDFYYLRLNGDLNGDGCNDLVIDGAYNVDMLYGDASFSNSVIMLPELGESNSISECFYARFDDTDYLAVSQPLDSTLFVLEYDPIDTVSVAYAWHDEDTFTVAWMELDYFIGDFNGDGNGDILLSRRPNDDLWKFRILTTHYVSVEEHTKPVQACNLSCYPNPSRGNNTIRFSLPQPAQAEVSIYNIRGQQVRTLAKAAYATGEHTLCWDGADDRGRTCADGVYFLRLTSGSMSVTQKALLLR